MAKESRTISILYLAVATGSNECLSLLFDELTNINIEEGLELKIKG
jgi:hypothetical protein